MILLTDKEFEYIFRFVKDEFGINLEKKRNLIQSRLQKTLTDKKFTSFTEYLNLLKDKKSDEITNFLNHITTNHTFFFREEDHFELLKDKIFPELSENGARKNLNIWSAGCSSGEEVFSILMTMYNYWGMNISQVTQKLLATDISQKVMTLAKTNTYTEDSLKNISRENKAKFFQPVPGTDSYKIKQELINRVDFKYLNLMSNFPYRNNFDIIFCRNVMIYFDNETREKLLKKFYTALKPGGYFIIGHSETITSLNTDFKYIKPSVYYKEK